MLALFGASTALNVAARAGPVRMEAKTITPLPASVKSGVVTGEALWDLLEHAKENGYAIPAVNVVSSCSITACLEAAKTYKGPMIVQFSRGGGQFIAGKAANNDNDAACIAGCVAGALHTRAVAELYDVPVILHTDHCMRSWLPWFDGLMDANEKYFKENGEPLFSSHMLDLSGIRAWWRQRWLSLASADVLHSALVPGMVHAHTLQVKRSRTFSKNFPSHQRLKHRLLLAVGPPVHCWPALALRLSWELARWRLPEVTASSRPQTLAPRCLVGCLPVSACREGLTPSSRCSAKSPKTCSPPGTWRARGSSPVQSEVTSHRKPGRTKTSPWRIGRRSWCSASRSLRAVGRSLRPNEQPRWRDRHWPPSS